MDNFRVTKEGFVKIIDFGISMEYMLDGVHKREDRYGFQGTPHCASIKALNGFTQSRRSDLEALGYAIMCIIDNDAVPWNKLTAKEDIIT